MKAHLETTFTVKVKHHRQSCTLSVHCQESSWRQTTHEEGCSIQSIQSNVFWRAQIVLCRSACCSRQRNLWKSETTAKEVQSRDKAEKKQGHWIYERPHTVSLLLNSNLSKNCGPLPHKTNTCDADGNDTCYQCVVCLSFSTKFPDAIISLRHCYK